MKVEKWKRKVDIKFTQDNLIQTTECSVFLAGPTPRSEDVPSWRPEAIDLFEKHMDNDLTVFVPEPNWEKDMTFAELNLKYAEQIIEWEHQAIAASNVILMWVPRDLKDMPAFTTNVEFGLYVKEYKLYYGRPDSAPKNRYLDYCYEKFIGKKPASTLESLVKDIVKIIN